MYVHMQTDMVLSPVSTRSKSHQNYFLARTSALSVPISPQIQKYYTFILLLPSRLFEVDLFVLGTIPTLVLNHLQRYLDHIDPLQTIYLDSCQVYVYMLFYQVPARERYHRDVVLQRIGLYPRCPHRVFRTPDRYLALIFDTSVGQLLMYLKIGARKSNTIATQAQNNKNDNTMSYRTGAA